MCIAPGAVIRTDPERAERYRRYEEARRADTRPKGPKGLTVGFEEFLNEVVDLVGFEAMSGVGFIDAPAASFGTHGAIVVSTDVGYLIDVPRRKRLGPYADGQADVAARDVLAAMAEDVR